MWYVLPTPIVLKYFKTYLYAKTTCSVFSLFYMENICELYVKAMFIMFALFLSYLNSIKANTIQTLLNQLFPMPFYCVNSIPVLCKGYLFSMIFYTVDYEV